ncbi:MAG: aminoglycoside phosphotransferase family protein [Planctomycetota bacterium]
MSDDLTAVPQSVRERLILAHQITAIQLVSGGMSGASVFRCEGPQRYALRRWPPTSVARFREIHRVVETAGGECKLFPKWHIAADQSDLVLDEHRVIWDLCDWMPGEPLETSATQEQIVRGVAAIAIAHRGMARLGEDVGTSAAVAERIQRVRAIQRQLPRALARIDGTPSQLLSTLQEARRVLIRWETVWDALTRRLASLEQDQFLRHFVLRDIHREHILFQDGTPSGIIDFDAIRRDTPLLDLSRWVAGFDQFRDRPAEVIDAALAGYRGEKRFRAGTDGSQDRKLVGLLAAATTWIGLANWVVWIALDSRQFSDWQRVRMRIARLVDLAPRLRDWI